MEPLTCRLVVQFASAEAFLFFEKVQVVKVLHEGLRRESLGAGRRKLKVLLLRWAISITVMLMDLILLQVRHCSFE